MESSATPTISQRVTILLEKHDADDRWTAHVPLIPHCFAEGTTPETAVEAIKAEIAYAVEKNPEILEELQTRPRFFLDDVMVNLTKPDVLSQNHV